MSLSPLDSIPVLSSNSNASASLYLDFNGHFEAVWGSHTNITTPAYDFDGDATTFSDVELANIRAIWETVAEDYAPFNINVTTEEPSVLAPGVPIANANKVALRVAVGALEGGWISGGYGGVAQYNSFTNSYANVAYVFTQAGINNPFYTPVTWGNIASHEAGHSFGLYHNNPVNIYSLMSESAGGTYASTVWAVGEKSPGVWQDDMAVLANTTNGFGYRSDDVGNTPGSATALTPAGNTWNGAGIVGNNTDVDVFSFHVTTEDAYRMAVKGVPVVANVDVALELRNAAGQLIAFADPSESRDAEIITVLSSGDYYVSVMNPGLWGRVGQYTVSVDAPPAAIIVTPPAPVLTTGEDGRQASFPVVLHTQPLADVIIAVQSSNTAEGTVSVSCMTFTPANWDVAQIVTITGVNDAVIDGDLAYSIVLATAVSSDLNYQGVNPSDVAVINLDNEPLTTKFYVVNDASQNHTYEYNTTGTSVETYVLYTGNTAPRGAASTIVGDKTWVVDANRKVYVYSNNGRLLGSWTAGTLGTKAVVEGIATNGTDIWIVDAYSDKVYKYTGAATRLSGSQNAASSFSLNIGNLNPKDIVTDGTHLWVVNDNIGDKVFKYTVAGALQGSWKLTGDNGGSPTGITLDPANVSNLWIVDSATDRVYQYNAAASRTWGLQIICVEWSQDYPTTVRVDVSRRDIRKKPSDLSLGKPVPLSLLRQDKDFALGHVFDILLQALNHFIEANLPLNRGLDLPVNQHSLYAIRCAEDAQRSASSYPFSKIEAGNGLVAEEKIDRIDVATRYRGQRSVDVHARIPRHNAKQRTRHGSRDGVKCGRCVDLLANHGQLLDKVDVGGIQHQFGSQGLQ